ncbi:MAG: hypothetical protein JNL70_23210 [Saprospiraceae bacterium]|nr:hypothetical protein [Saprospiraceae bacterium]
MKNNKLLLATLFLLLIGAALTYIGMNINGTWRDNIKSIGNGCLLIAGVLGAILILVHKLSAQEEST